MPKNQEQAELEKKFEKLTEQLRRGWIKTHPLTEKEKDVVRNAVREGLKQEQKEKNQIKEKSEAGHAKKEAHPKTQRQEKNKPQDHGHGFGHSH